MARGDLEVNITAIDRASDKIKDVAKQAERLGDEEGEIVLKAEVKNAEKDLRRLRKELKEADGEEAEVRILADIAQAKSDIAALDGELDKIDGRKVEVEVEADDAQGAGEDAGSMFGAGAIKSVGAAGIGAAIVGAFNSGMDRLQLQARFQSEFGLVAEDAERLGGRAADIYRDGWGDSLDEVMGALGRVNQALVETGQISDDETDGMVEAALAIAGVYGEDVDAVIRSTGLLMKNGLAADATEATDVIIAGLQDGANEADDFFDTIDEYAQHFGAMGLSGADMNAIIVAGFQDGQRDADKLADAVKEMRIRTVEDTDAISDAYNELGLNADEYRTKIASGGDTARTAFIDILRAIQSVEDPVRQQAIAVELIGTQYEDLGDGALDALLALDGATQDLVGRTDELVQVQAEATSEVTTFWRNLTGVTGEAAEKFAAVANDFIAASQAQGDARNDLLATYEAEEEGLGKLGGSIAKVKDENAALSVSMVQASIDAALMAKSTDKVTESEEDATDATEDRTEALRDLMDRIDELEGKQASLVGGTMAVENAQIAAKDAAHEFDLALLGVDEQGKEVKLTADEMTLAFNDATTSQMNAAQAAVDYEIAQREASGETVTATEKNGLLAQAYRDQAETLAPGNPLRQRLLDYATELDEIPAEVNSTVLLEADTSQAERDLEWAARARTALISARYTGQGQAMFDAQNRSHTGSRFAAGETKIVVPGQVFTPDVGGRMSSVEESRRMTSGDPSGTTNITNNVYVESDADPYQIAAALDRMNRIKQ